MKQFKPWLLIWSALILFSASCHDKGEDCMCKENEVCIPNAYTGNNDCYLYASVHYLNGTRVIAPNSYEGVTTGSFCVDTLIFYNDTSRAITDERFGLIVPDPPQGVLNVLGSEVPLKVSESEYYASTVAPLCHLNGEGWYANLHYIIYQDSVWMQLKFWTLESQPNEFIDSTTVMFFKKK